jgi:hypothetical protein
MLLFEAPIAHFIVNHDRRFGVGNAEECQTLVAILAKNDEIDARLVASFHIPVRAFKWLLCN